MIVALDMDVPIVDLHPYWLDLYNRDYNDNVTVDQITTWEMHPHVKYGMKIYDYLRKRHFFYNAPPTPGAIEAVERINRKHEVLIVTHCPPGPGFQEKLEWLEKWMPFIKPEQVIFTRKKHLVAADILLDDCPEHLEFFLGYKVAWDMPYNRDIEASFRLRGTPEAKWKQFELWLSELDEVEAQGYLIWSEVQKKRGLANCK